MCQSTLRTLPDSVESKLTQGKLELDDVARDSVNVWQLPDWLTPVHAVNEVEPLVSRCAKFSQLNSTGNKTQHTFAMCETGVEAADAAVATAMAANAA